MCSRDMEHCAVETWNTVRSRDMEHGVPRDMPRDPQQWWSLPLCRAAGLRKVYRLKEVDSSE